MNFGSIYTGATRTIKDAPEPENFSPAEDATRKQVKLDWLNSTITQETFAAIGKEMENLIAQSIVLAASYPTHNNYQQIIQNLIRVDALRKVIKQYGSN